MSLSPAESPSPGPDRVPVPRTLTDLLSADWLSAALGHRFPGVRVSRVTPGPAGRSAGPRQAVRENVGLPLARSLFYIDRDEVFRHLPLRGTWWMTVRSTACAS
jgi:hypothetical protein